MDKKIIECYVASLYYIKAFETNEKRPYKEEILQTIEEKVLFIILLKISRYKIKDQEKSKQEELFHYKEGKIRSYLSIAHFIQLLKQEVGIKLKGDDEFIYGMINYCRRFFYKVLLKSNLKRPKKCTTT